MMPLFDWGAFDVIAAKTDTCPEAADGQHCDCWDAHGDCCWCCQGRSR